MHIEFITEQTAFDAVELGERLELVARGLFTLTPAEYKVVYAALSGVTVMEYAQTSKKSYNVCHKHYMQGIKKLQRYIEKAGVK